MRVRGLKQVLHWLFLIVGIFSMVMLAFSVNTYLGYAREGYGLELEFEGSWLHYDDWLVLRFSIVNSGGLDVDIRGGNVTLGDTYVFQNTQLPNGLAQEFPIPVEARDNSSMLLWVKVEGQDLADIRDSGLGDFRLELDLYVAERYAETHLVYSTIAEVGP